MRRKSIERIVRVDHAGEYAAVCIYHGQELALKNTAEVERIREMKQHELEHFAYFDKALRERRVRPTVFMPIWHVAAVSLGYVSASLGKEAAMACTEAVEEVICSHYDEQAKELELCGGDAELKDMIEKFREEEREHMEVAAKHGASLAPGYEALSHFVKTACKMGIAISKVL